MDRFNTGLLTGALALLSLTGSVSAYALDNFHPVTPKIFRSARPADGDFAQIKASGIKRIIDLEDDAVVAAHEQQVAAANGIEWISKPMHTFEPVNVDQLNQVLATLVAPSAPVTLVHCMGGQDRTGIVIGLYRVLVQNWKPADSHSEMVYYGFHTSYTELENYYWTRAQAPR